MIPGGTPPETGSESATPRPGTSHTATGVNECRQCGHVSLSVGGSTTSTCCDLRPSELDCAPDAVERPELESILRVVFGLPGPTVDICDALTGAELRSTRTIAEEFDYDDSTASRHLNRLVEVGFLERVQLNRREGGIVNVYRTLPADELGQQLIDGFALWSSAALAVLEGFQADLSERPTDDTQSARDAGSESIFWEERDADTTNEA